MDEEFEQRVVMDESEMQRVSRSIVCCKRGGEGGSRASKQASKQARQGKASQVEALVAAALILSRSISGLEGGLSTLYSTCRLTANTTLPFISPEQQTLFKTPAPLTQTHSNAQAVRHPLVPSGMDRSSSFHHCSRHG